jgi:hypothetical protein
MVTVLNCLKAVLLVAVSFFFIEAGFFIKDVKNKITSTSDSINGAITVFTNDANKLGTTLDAINNPDPRRGTLKLLNKDLVDVKDLIVLTSQTAQTVAQTSKLEANYATKWDEQVSSTLVHVDSIAVTANESLLNTSNSLQKSMVEISPTLIQAQGTMKSAQELISNPDLAESMKNLNTSSKALSGISTDTQQWWHDELHPKWPARAWHIVSNTGITVAKFFW